MRIPDPVVLCGSALPVSRRTFDFSRRFVFVPVAWFETFPRFVTEFAVIIAHDGLVLVFAFVDSPFELIYFIREFLNLG